MKRKITNTHFTLETRIIIENYLNEGKNITQVANEKEIVQTLERKLKNIDRWFYHHHITRRILV